MKTVPFVDVDAKNRRYRAFEPWSFEPMRLVQDAAHNGEHLRTVVELPAATLEQVGAFLIDHRHLDDALVRSALGNLPAFSADMSTALRKMENTVTNLEALPLIKKIFGDSANNNSTRKSNGEWSDFDEDVDKDEQSGDRRPIYLVVDNPTVSWRRRLLSDVKVGRNMDAQLRRADEQSDTDGEAGRSERQAKGTFE